MRLLILAASLAACGGGSSPAPSLCDLAQLSYTCGNPNGQCVEFTGLSTADRNSVQSGCTSHGGTAVAGACTTSGRIGTCVIPTTTPNSGVTCSPSGHIAIRYFAPFTADQAKGLCDGVSGSNWTPN
jgi:hypothetical protein